MTYEQSEAYIHSFRPFPKQAGRMGIATLLDELENPHKNLQFVHIAGTNGKGSTTAMCASVLKEAGYRTGMFVSPYVLTFRERMQINEKMIAPETMVALVQEIKQAVQRMTEKGFDPPAEFEVVTALGLLWFAKEQCDVVCLEVGLGGRLDATNIIEQSLVSIIGAIGFDHTHILGDTPTEIAAEKCGILKPGGTCVTYPLQQDEALAEIMRCAAGAENRLILPNASSVEIIKQDLFGSRFVYGEKEFSLSLAGEHQIYNALMVIEAVHVLRQKGFSLSDEHLTRGIEKTFFPARMERICENPLVVLDGAHNLQGCEALSQAMEGFAGKKVVIMGMLADKNWKESSLLIAQKSDVFFTVSPNIARALPAEELTGWLQKNGIDAHSCRAPAEAATAAKAHLDSDSALFCCGSLYLASEMRPILYEHFGKKRPDPNKI